ncbi:hypothetical protein [Cytobacillus purgationiresistens]|uniref:Hemoglobin-like flavoprotein n=1 Tax=Cytobacillus purgationiresistens TaxID=863449 RepID=A0ABU0ACA4_9BACI|nr:hypothetical protein [Cytobacillus purgationiresistens]MDQ0268886.1 hemoglobin-like flavoprotein [Cytobacillus purgationiresistens]
MDVQCDNCNQLYNVNPIDKKHGNGIVETYFTCPLCNHHHLVYVTNQSIRRQQYQIRKLYESIPVYELGTDYKKDYLKKFEAHFKKIKDKKKKLEVQMNKLKEQFASS